MDYATQRANEIAKMRELDNARARAKVPLPMNVQGQDLRDSQAVDYSKRLDALPNYARGRWHYCSECGKAMHTLCPATGKSQEVVVSQHTYAGTNITIHRGVCTGCTEQNVPNVHGDKFRCHNCDPNLDDLNPRSPQNLAIKAEHERKSRERAEVERNREMAWPVIQERLIDEYLQSQGLKWRVEA